MRGFVQAAALAGAALLASQLTACAVGRSLFTSSEDLTDYRAFRLAAHEGVRLARADRYLERHPRGAWHEEVRAVFDEEEPAYFEKASETRAQISEYLADLPRGPHADAAIALLTAFDAHVEDLATDRLLRQARLTEVNLDHANLQRRGIGEAILASVAALLDPDLYGARQGDLPAPARRALGGLAPASWGHPEPVRTDDYLYSVPTHLARESRLVTLKFALVFDHDHEPPRVSRGVVSGADLFVHWDEADEVKGRDPSDPRDRAAAAAHAVDLLDGALEAHLPSSRCAVNSSAPREILVRRCDGWEVVVTIGASLGDADAIVVSGPMK